MSDKNKTILKKGNAAILAGNYDGFLEFCTEDTLWEFVGEQTLQGKQAVSEYMKEVYLEAPKFTVDNMVEEGDYLTVIGEIALKQMDGKWLAYDYCDVWRFEGDKIASLRGFVIAKMPAK
ncbi:nuclear transport factor 2 family protein [Pedobacter aquatilis]|uniref:nuclear transport factor 2 family protein n=1 Tax=Pedobacter aquatilis TaxID=351343 RepID=UPI00292DDA7B|nr:nuclear transport factor 2 family protein [Pedobacter aquatilis]